jgi:hypothetical protein
MCDKHFIVIDLIWTIQSCWQLSVGISFGDPCFTIYSRDAEGKLQHEWFDFCESLHHWEYIFEAVVQPQNCINLKCFHHGISLWADNTTMFETVDCVVQFRVYVDMFSIVRVWFKWKILHTCVWWEREMMFWNVVVMWGEKEWEKQSQLDWVVTANCNTQHHQQNIYI